MFSRVGLLTLRRSTVIFQLNRGVSGRISCSLPHFSDNAFRLFSTTENKSDNTEQTKVLNDNGFTPEGAVFSNPQIGSEWIYREEKDTGRKYYINTKTNEILYNRTRDSELAPRWRRIAAGAIDLGVSVSRLLI